MAEKVWRVSRSTSGFSELRKKGIECDVILAAGNKEVKVHRLILIASGDYFEKIFSADFKEKSEKKINLECVEESLLECLVDFIYGDEIELTEENVYDLLSASHHLLLSELTDKCLMFLIEIVNVANCLLIRGLGDLYCSSDLVKKTSEIILNNFEALSKTEEFLSLSIDALLVVLNLHGKTSTRDEDTCFSSILSWVTHSFEKRETHLFQLLENLDPSCFTAEQVMQVDDNVLIKDSLAFKNFVVTVASTKTKINNTIKGQKIDGNSKVIFAAGGDGEQTVEYLDLKLNEWCCVKNIVNESCYDYYKHPPNHCLMSDKESRQMTMYVPERNIVGDVFKCTNCYGAFINEKFLYVFNSYGSNVYDYSVNPRRNYVVNFPSKLDKMNYGACLLRDSNTFATIGGSNGPNLADVGSNEVVLFRYRDSELLKKTECSKFATMHMKYRRLDTSVISCESYFYIVGGRNGGSTLKSVEKLDIIAQISISLPDLNVARFRATVTLSDGKLYVIGGHNGFTRLSSMEVLDLNNGTSWELHPANMLKARVQPGICIVDKKDTAQSIYE